MIPLILLIFFWKKRKKKKDAQKQANRPYRAPKGAVNNRPVQARQQGERPTERPRLNLNPPAPKPSAQATELHDNISKPTGSLENPFGTAIIDRQKMDEMFKHDLPKTWKERKT